MTPALLAVSHGRKSVRAAGLLVAGIVSLTIQSRAAAFNSAEPGQNQAAVFLTNNIDRPLRYTPIGTDFVITNGVEFFNRPLYGGSSAFRVDAGDVPEFSLYLPGRGGNLRLGLSAGGKTKWLHEARQIIARYRPGAMVYEIRDPLLGAGTLHLEALAPHESESFILRAEVVGSPGDLRLLFAFGGVNGMRGARDGDIGCEREPVAKFFQLHADQCASNQFVLGKNSFVVRGKPGLVGGVFSNPAKLAVADASDWADAEKLFVAPNPKSAQPVLTGELTLTNGRPSYIGLQRLAAANEAEELLAVYREVSALPGGSPAFAKTRQWQPKELPDIFATTDHYRQTLAGRVGVETPDPFINAAAAALNVAADAVWDDRQEAYLHGGVAWRVRLLGWRVSYAGDELGWPERTARHFEGFARQQNTEAIPVEIPPPEAGANLARNETALHSNGDLTHSHYDMNLVGVDAFFRHLLWTGDTNFAREMWPVIERHLAWERRLFRREFGPDKLPLYEAYCCIWASDDLAYNGGGATHSSAYNLFHNRMAARVARLLGRDAQPYEREAELIARGMQENLWLADRGWFAEWKDLLGLQLVHPNAAAWTCYHAVDCEVPSPQQAWQMTRFVDTQIARFPLRGPGVPPGSYTMPTTSWMPYTWSLNNVVMAETMHTALAYWQANRPEGAFPLFKGALLDSMYLGLCPGNVGMCTYFDATRRESQRDFGDGIGAMSRALVEGLFGVHPDMLAGELRVQPGFPPEWNSANIQHPDFDFAFQRADATEKFSVTQKFSWPMALRLQVPALRDGVASVLVNGQPVKWQMVQDCVGWPRIEITAAAVRRQDVVIQWRGRDPGRVTGPAVVERGGKFEAQTDGQELSVVSDPQNALSDLSVGREGFRARATGTPGQRTVFAQLRQGELSWCQPVAFEIRSAAEVGAVTAADWNRKFPTATKFQPVELTTVFNDRVTQIFRNEYRSPRSPFCSLATPKQGVGSWCHPQARFAVDDVGLRAAAARHGGEIFLPNGVPLVTPAVADAKNIVFVSQWDNYPKAVTVPITGRSAHAFLLMAGSTTAMQSRFDNGEVIVAYTDGSTARLALHNPTTWWPIDQDYYIDDFAFARPEPLPVRVDLKTGNVRVLEMESFKGKGRVVPGGAATVLDLPLDPAKELKTLTVRALANEVVIGLMSLTLQR